MLTRRTEWKMEARYFPPGMMKVGWIPDNQRRESILDFSINAW